MTCFICMPTLYQELKSLYDDVLKKMEMNPRNFVNSNVEINENLERDAEEIAKRYGARGAEMLAFTNSKMVSVEILCKFPDFNNVGVMKNKLRDMGYVVEKDSRKLRAKTTEEYHVSYYTDYKGKSWTVAFNAYIDYDIEENNKIWFEFGLSDEEKVSKALNVIYPVFGLNNAPSNIDP